LEPDAELGRYLQISVDDGHVVQVFDRVQDLVDELAGVSLRVEALLHDPVEQLASRNAAEKCTGRCHPSALSFTCPDDSLLSRHR